MEDLLAGRRAGARPEARRRAQRRAGGRRAGRLVAAALIGEAGDEHRLRAAASAIGRACASPVEPLAVVRQGEVVCVTPALDTDARSRQHAQQRLAGDGIPLAIGVSGSFPDLAGVPEAYGEASAAVGAAAPRRRRPGDLGAERLRLPRHVRPRGRAPAHAARDPGLRRPTTAPTAAC